MILRWIYSPTGRSEMKRSGIELVRQVEREEL